MNLTDVTQQPESNGGSNHIKRDEDEIHTIRKRNTMFTLSKRDEKLLLKRVSTTPSKSRLLNRMRQKYSRSSKSTRRKERTLTPSTTTSLIPVSAVIGPAQWLTPFDFTFIKNSNSRRLNISLFPELMKSQRANQMAAESTTPDSLSSSYMNSLERSLLKLNQSYLNRNIIKPEEGYWLLKPRSTEKITSSTATTTEAMTTSTSTTTTISTSSIKTTTTTMIQSTNRNFNINDYLSCERNLTRLTVFYSGIDILTCVQPSNKSSLLKCMDEILETKLILKLGYFYYSQLQPLMISKTKMNCTEKESTNDEGEQSEEKRKVSLKNFLISNRFKPKWSSSLIDAASFTGKSLFKCRLMLKKASHRKKLIWNLYLILKNQTCIPNMNYPIGPRGPTTKMSQSNEFTTTTTIDSPIGDSSFNGMKFFNFIGFNIIKKNRI